MTAFAFDLAPDRLAIASDSVVYSTGATARAVGFASKVLVLPRLRLALCGRGILEIVAEVHRRLAVMPLATFGETVALLPEIARDVTEQWATANGLDDHNERQVIELLFGGFDREAGRARLFAAYNYENFVPQELPPGAGCGVVPALPPELRPEIAGLPLLPPEYVPAGLGRVPPEQALVALMKAMRRFLAEHPEVVPALVGGEVQITEITAKGVNSRIVHRFEDFEQVRVASAAVRARIERGEDVIDIETGVCRVDDAIDFLASGAATAGNAAAPAPGANRAERRRQEKLARKAAKRRAA